MFLCWDELEKQAFSPGSPASSHRPKKHEHEANWIFKIVPGCKCESDTHTHTYIPTYLHTYRAPIGGCHEWRLHQIMGHKNTHLSCNESTAGYWRPQGCHPLLTSAPFPPLCSAPTCHLKAFLHFLLIYSSPFLPKVLTLRPRPPLTLI